MTTAPAATRQLLDPAGTLGVYPTTISLTVVTATVSIACATSGLLRGAHVPLLLIAMGSFVFSCVVVFRSADPARAPFSRRAHVLVHVTAVLAYLLAVIATPAFAGRFLVDSWAATGLGLLLIAIAPYRPVREILISGSISAAVIAVVAFVHATNRIPDIPPLAIAIGTVLPILAFCYADGVYAAATIRSLERSQQRAELAGEALADDLRQGIAHDVGHDRVSILQRDVVPFLSRVTDRDRIDDADRDLAIAIADSVRRVMVAEADRSWLEVVMSQLDARIEDPSRAAEKMNGRQRTALRAFVVAARDDPAARDLSISFSAPARGGAGALSLRVDASESRIRSTYSPFFAVMRVSFVAAALEIDAPYLIVRFDL